MKRFLLLAVGILTTGCAVLLPDFLSGDGIAHEQLVGTLFLNEVSADNPASDDWVELYNDDADGVDLSGFFLTDDPSYPQKWSFPFGSGIAGGSHYVVYCGGSGPETRTDFQLAANADGVYLATPDGVVIDSLVTAPATGTGSYGRTTDGGTPWVVFLTPTKGSANH